MSGAVSDKWTAERLVLLRELWPQRIPRAKILPRINALPGPPIASVAAMATKASALGLRQDSPAAPVPVPPAMVPAAVRPPRQELARAVPSPVAPGDFVIYADYDQIRGWAGERGITYDRLADLDRVNAKRRQFFLPPFAPRMARRPDPKLGRGA